MIKGMLFIVMVLALFVCCGTEPVLTGTSTELPTAGDTDTPGGGDTDVVLGGDHDVTLTQPGDDDVTGGDTDTTDDGDSDEQGDSDATEGDDDVVGGDEDIATEDKHEYKVVLCHKDKKTISVGEKAVEAHLKHWDYLGECE